MLPFDPQDPFPQLPDGIFSYAEEQAHSEHVDDWLGFRIGPIENTIHPVDRQNVWSGLSPRALQTPYSEIRSLLERLQLTHGQTLVDLGAGYGRMALVVGRHFPEVRFVGYELVDQRVAEGRRILDRFQYPNVTLLPADLAHPDFSPIAADVYFLYDFGCRDAISKALADLARIAKTRPIRIIGRGRASRDEIERACPWLSQVIRPEHFARYSIYRSA